MPSLDRAAFARWAILTSALSLCALGPARSADVDALVEALLRNENFKVRLKAAAALGQVPGERSALTLRTALGDPHGLVRAAAANALGRLRDPQALPDLCRLGTDPDAFVRKTVREALARFGSGDVCTPRRVFVAVEVLGDDAPSTDFVRGRVLERCGADARVMLGPSGEGADPRAEVEAGRLPGVELKLRVRRAIDRTPTTTRVRCEVFQSVYDLKLRALRGSATQKAEIDLGSPTVKDEIAEKSAKECFAALVPVVYEGFSDYLDRLR